MNLPARHDSRGSGDVHALRVRDDRVHNDRAHDVCDDRGVPSGVGHPIPLPVQRGRAIYCGMGIQSAGAVWVGGVGTEGKVRGGGRSRREQSMMGR